MRKRTRTDIGQRLLDWMMQNPMSTGAVADLIGISRNSVLCIARGSSEPRNEVRCKIEKFLKDKNG